jgi:3-oxoacyl-[acyl-carrier protein] reductase
MAVVTGGSGAIGSAVVSRFVDEGHIVAVLDRRPMSGDLADRPEVLQRICELSNHAAVDRVLTDLTADGSQVKYFVGVAGGAVDAEVVAQQRQELPGVAAFRESIEDNLMAQYVPLRALVPHLARTSGDRAIVLVSSINALAGFGMPAYSAAKAGLIGLVNALTGPLGAEGIRINVVAPGTIPTPKTEAFWGSAGTRDMLRYGALPAAGTPEQAAEAVLSICTRLSHVTGQVLVVDGGQLVHRPMPAPA